MKTADAGEARSNERNHIGFLDAIRGLAILFVFLFHSLWPVAGTDTLPWGSGWFTSFSVKKSFLLLLPFSFGWSGVAIFFVVSGFCIHFSFKRKPVWREFWLRRFFRIYPPYFFALLFFAFIFPWTRMGPSLLDALQLGSHLLLIHNFDPRFVFGISGSFWTIAVEVQLYLLYPLLLAFVSRLGWRRALFYIALLETGIRGINGVYLTWTGDELPWAFPLPFTYWFSWSIGAYIADAYLERRPIPFAGQPLCLWVFLVILGRFVKPLSTFSFLFVALATATLIAGLLSNRKFSIRIPQFALGPLQSLGLWSYSIYLLHQPFLIQAPRLAGKLAVTAPGSFGYIMRSHVLHPLFMLFLCLSLSVPVVFLSALWYRFCELPGIALGKRLIAKTAGTGL